MKVLCHAKLPDTLGTSSSGDCLLDTQLWKKKNQKIAKSQNG